MVQSVKYGHTNTRTKFDLHDLCEKPGAVVVLCSCTGDRGLLVLAGQPV